MNFIKIYIISVLLVTVYAQIQSEIFTCKNATVSRNKRALAFPFGALFLFAFCNTNLVIIQQPGPLFTLGVHYGLGYYLPQANYVARRIRKKHNRLRNHQRNRREVYSNLQMALDKLGYSGEACIHRALCEAGSIARDKRKSRSIAEELVKIIFRYTLHSSQNHTTIDKEYGKSYSDGKQIEYEGCATLHLKCPVSIVDAALGYYNDHSFPQTPIDMSQLLKFI